MIAPTHVAAAQRSPRLVSLLRSISQITSILVIFIGGLGLLGWMFDIRLLKSGIPGMVVMKANTTIALLLMGVALLCLHMSRRARAAQVLFYASATIALLIGALTLGERLLVWDAGIDQLLFIDSVDTVFPGRMGLNSALGLTLLCLAILLLDMRHGIWPANLLVVLVLCLAWPTLVGYLYEITSLYTIRYFAAVAFPTALALILLGFGILGARPERGLFGLVVTTAAGDLMARRLLPAALVIPFLLGWLHWQGLQAQIYDIGFGLASMVASSTLLFTALIWWNAHTITQLDSERRLFAEALRSSIEDITEHKRAIAERAQAEAALRRYAERLSHLHKIDQAILSLHSLEAITHAAVTHLRHLVPTTSVSVARIDHKTQEASLLALHNGEFHISPGMWIPLRGGQDVLECLLRGEVYLGEDLPDLPIRLQTARTPVRSSIAVPIMSSTELIGAICLGSDREGPFLPEYIEIAREVAGQLSVAMEQIRLQEQNQHHTRQLEMANKELEAFSYTVSHDLRAPLRSVDGFSRILLEEHLADLPLAAQEYLHLVRENAQQMDRLIRDLLAFARQSRQPLHKQLVAPADLIRQAINDLRDEQEGRQITLHVGELPLCMADPALLRLVYVNLLANALKFTRGRVPATIEIGVHWDAACPDEPVYFVRDNGAGFDMRYVGKLFGVFQRLHRAEEYEGTGVGLATVQRIVRRHGGRVWAEGAVGRGATISFMLRGEPPDD